MTPSRSHPAPHRPTAVLLALALAGCAAVEANRRTPGVVAGGSFTPARAGSATYGPDASRTCPVGGAYSQTLDQLEKAVKDRGASPAVQDGQLCAVAEAFLAWPEGPNPREAVRLFTARHFGMAGTPPQLVINTLESDDTRKLGESLSSTIMQFANQAPQARWGIAVERLAKDRTRVVIALDSGKVALDPLPRRLEPGQTATFSGKLLGDLENPKVVVSDVKGVVHEPAQAPGKAFKAELACPTTGRLVVELRAEEMGNELPITTLEIPCGGPPLPTSVALAPAPWPEGVAEQEARLAKAIDAERAAGGVPALAWNEAVARIARAQAEFMRDNAKKPGSAQPVNLVQRLSDADMQALTVLQNPAAGPTAEIASDRLLLSPPHRATIMSTEVALAGVGVAMGADQAGKPLAYLVQLFVKVQAPPDVPVLRRTLVEVVGKKRAEEKLPALSNDPALEKLAADYALEVAAAGGPPPKARTEAFEKALKAGWRDIVIIRDARFDLNDFGEDPNILSKGKLYGLGTALGRHPRLGKNTLFVVLVVANKLPGKK